MLDNKNTNNFNVNEGYMQDAAEEGATYGTFFGLIADGIYTLITAVDVIKASSFLVSTIPIAGGVAGAALGCLIALINRTSKKQKETGKAEQDENTNGLISQLKKAVGRRKAEKIIKEFNNSFDTDFSVDEAIFSIEDEENVETKNLTKEEINNYKQLLKEMSNSYEVIVEQNGSFNISAIPENEVDMILNNIKKLDFVEEANKDSGAFDYNASVEAGQPKDKKYNIYGKIQLVGGNNLTEEKAVATSRLPWQKYKIAQKIVHDTVEEYNDSANTSGEYVLDIEYLIKALQELESEVGKLVKFIVINGNYNKLYTCNEAMKEINNKVITNLAAIYFEPSLKVRGQEVGAHVGIQFSSRKDSYKNFDKSLYSY